MVIKFFSSYQEVECFSNVSVQQAVGIPFLLIGDLFIEVELVVNGDTKEIEVFTNWYRCIIAMELLFRSL